MSIQEYLSNLQSLLGSQTCQPRRLPTLYVSCVKLCFKLLRSHHRLLCFAPILCSVHQHVLLTLPSVYIPVQTFLLLNHLSSYCTGPNSCLSLRRLWWPSEVFLLLLSSSVYAPQRRPSMNILSHPLSSSDIISFIASVITWIPI